MRAEGAPTFVADAGNLFAKHASIKEADRAQATIKARLLAEGHALAGIDAMLPGAGELAFGLPFLQELGKEHELPWVATNLQCDGRAPFAQERLVSRGGLNVLFLGVEGESARAEGCVVTDAAAAVKAAADGTDADLVVVLSGQRIDADEALAKAVPRIDLVVNGQERRFHESAEVLPEGALHLAAGSRGKHLGVLRFTLTPGATAWRDDGALSRLAERRDRQRKRLEEIDKKLQAEGEPEARTRLQRQMEFYRKEVDKVEAELFAGTGDGPTNVGRNDLVELDADLPDHAATAALVAAAKAEIASATPTVSGPSALATGPFAGSSACTGCHAAEAAQWGATPHARALASLEEAGRARDRECFTCHVTGAMHPDGPTDPGAVAGLENVGCESCHGPGKAHLTNPQAVGMTNDPGETGCVTCHDGQQDGGRFDYATYRPKVVHGAAKAAGDAMGAVPAPAGK